MDPVKEMKRQSTAWRKHFKVFAALQLFNIVTHGLQHTRLPCPSLSPGVCSNSCPLSWWCHPTISSSVAPFSSCPQSFPASKSFPLRAVVQSVSPVSDPMDCSKPGFPVFHYLLEFAQIHAHWVGDAIQPSHPLSSPSLPAFNLSQHQGLFQWIGSSHQVVKV